MKKKGSLELIEEPIPSEIFFGRGVAKLGEGVLSFSRKLGLPEDGGTCPGATTAPGGCLAPAEVTRLFDGKVFWVKRVCYPVRGHTAIWQKKGLYNGNIGPDVESPVKLRNALDKAMIKVKKYPGSAVLLRHGVEGDFDSVKYIRSWVQVLRWRRRTVFWAYSRSWVIPALRGALEELRALPNVQVFASMDMALWNAGRLPPGWFRLPSGEVKPVPGAWRVAMMGPVPWEVHNRATQCPETRLVGDPRKVPTCESCTYCFAKETRDSKSWLWFPLHWVILITVGTTLFL